MIFMDICNPYTYIWGTFDLDDIKKHETFFVRMIP